MGTAQRLIQEAKLGTLNSEDKEQLCRLLLRTYSDGMRSHPWVGEFLTSLEWGEDLIQATFGNGKIGTALPWGDCCAVCWFESVGELSEPAVILAVIEKNWEDFSEGEYGDVVEVCFWELVTEKETIQIETRLSHNGYYGGDVDWKIFEPDVT